MNIQSLGAASQDTEFPERGPSEVLPGLAQLIASELVPQVVDIDIHARYPKSFLHKVGALGGFASLTPPNLGGTGRGLKHAIQVIEEVSKACVSTGFLVWAQYALQLYLLNGNNADLAASVLPEITTGKILGGSGQSNPMKSCSGIEDVRLKATRVEGGYLINGTLPWVSNIGIDHYFHMGASLPGAPGLLIGLVRGDHPNLTLVKNARFIGMDGTNTYACQFREVFLPDEQVICHPRDFNLFRDRTKAPFILLQMGMGLGLVDACVAMMKHSNKTHAHVNRFLDVQVEDIEPILRAVRVQTYALADKIEDRTRGSATHIRETLELRLACGELSLKAAQAAMLHLGAKGYLINNAAQRRLREAYFIAIVTPAIKHLRKELYDLEQRPAACHA